MSSLDDFAASAARIATLHGGADGYAVTVRDHQATDSLSTGLQTDSPRSFTIACPKPTPYSPKMVDGQQIRSGDCSIWLPLGNPGITFAPEPGMAATVTGPGLGATGQQFAVIEAPLHAGAYELQLRSGSPEAA